MNIRRSLAVAGALAASSLALAAGASAATKVSVRVEGVSRTLLRAKTVTEPSRGSITKGGTPSGSCPAAGAAGALDVATHHDWSGKYSSGLGILVTTILGETDLYDAGHYWSIYVDDRLASQGICDLKLTAGQQLLFAAVPAKGTVHPIVIASPAKATVGAAFKVKAFYYPGKGNATKPLSGVSFSGVSGKTNRQGVATLTARRAGKLSLVGSESGEIRSAAQTVTVSK